MNRSFENLNDLKMASQKALVSLGDELKQYIDYFENEAGEELQSVWISGGASMSVGAPVVLSERLGKKVDIWDNTRKLEISGRLDLKLLKEHAAELNVAFGLALRP
jgi:Tfp pilus assembly PilM family ATPase